MIFRGRPAGSAAISRPMRCFASTMGLARRPVRSDRPGVINAEIDHWGAITLKGRLFFHPPDGPVQVWAVTIDPSGVHWFDTKRSGN
jgi:hypothetical protein